MEEYLDEQKAKEADMDKIYGVLYSFPESAIKAFKVNKPGARVRLVFRGTTGLGENYLYSKTAGGEDPVDVTLRERTKQLLKEAIKTDERYSLINQEQIENSKEKWRERLKRVSIVKK